MKILITAIALSLFSTTSIYDITVSGANGTTIDFNAFRNKKILIVNIATGSEYAYQLAALQQLQEQYQDSVVVIAFPSNSFGHESRDNTAIDEFCRTQYGVTFPIAAKGEVKGTAIQTAYGWLTRQSENSVLDSDVKSDFQKYLLDSHGELIGVFIGQVSPLDPQIVSNITGSN